MPIGAFFVVIAAVLSGEPVSAQTPTPPDVAKRIVTVSASTPDRPRKGEADVVELTDGRLLMVSMEFGGAGDDFATTRLVAHESPDGGQTWGARRVVAETASGDVNVYSPNLIRARDGGILLLFHRNHGKAEGLDYACTLYAWKSTDEGRTFAPWSEFSKRKEHQLCNATVKRLKSGRLLLPVSPLVPGDHGPAGKFAATVLYSDDDGRTWTEAAQRLHLPQRGAMEPHVEQASDGRVLMVVRSQLGTLHFSESTDDGVHWSELKASSLKSPESCPELVRIPKTGDLLVLWNNTFDPRFRSHFGKRSPLSAAISRDQGQTWKFVGDIETDPKRAFSNPGCRFTRDGRAIVNYWTCEYLPDWAMQDIIDLRVAVIDTAWFYPPSADGPAPPNKPENKPSAELQLGALRLGKVLFLGNSITLHSPAPNIGWTGNWGMAASSEDKDYVHQMVERIHKATGGRPEIRVRNIAEFERTLSKYDLDKNLKDDLEFGADVVIVAIGENAAAPQTDEARREFSESFGALLRAVSRNGRSTVFVRSQFWPDAVKDDLMKQQAQAAQVVWVDVGKLAADEANYARSERKFDHAGVAGHPGDRGMRALADALWAALQKQAQAKR